MSKMIAISFDDGRWDQTKTGIRILQKYKLRGTLYVTTAYVDGTMSDSRKMKEFGIDATTVEEVVKVHRENIEIGSHSDMHMNTSADIAVSLAKLNTWLGVRSKWGFASPGSIICQKNVGDILDIRARLNYVRTSGRLRNHNIFYIGLFLMNRYLHSKALFLALNKENKLHKDKSLYVVNSVAVRSETPVKHLIALCESLNDEEGIVFCFHSINKEVENGVWNYSVDDFEQFCCYISENSQYKSMTVSDLVSHLRGTQ